MFVSFLEDVKRSTTANPSRHSCNCQISGCVQAWFGVYIPLRFQAVSLLLVFFIETSWKSITSGWWVKFKCLWILYQKQENMATCSFVRDFQISKNGNALKILIVVDPLLYTCRQSSSKSWDTHPCFPVPGSTKTFTPQLSAPLFYPSFENCTIL